MSEGIVTSRSAVSCYQVCPRKRYLLENTGAFVLSSMNESKNMAGKLHSCRTEGMVNHNETLSFLQTIAVCTRLLWVDQEALQNPHTNYCQSLLWQVRFNEAQGTFPSKQSREVGCLSTSFSDKCRSARPSKTTDTAQRMEAKKSRACPELLQYVSAALPRASSSQNARASCTPSSSTLRDHWLRCDGSATSRRLQQANRNTMAMSAAPYGGRS